MGARDAGGANVQAQAAAVAVTARASANRVVPPFKFTLVYSAAGPGRILLNAFTIDPFFGAETIAGGCTQCTGPGHFARSTVKHHVLRDPVKGGAIFITHRTRFLQAVMQPGRIGRFKVVSVNTALPASEVLVRQGCLAADAPLTNNDFLNHRPLPELSCNARPPRGDRLTVITPPEVSATPKGGRLVGRAGGSRWLSLFVAHQPCAPDAQAEAQITSPSARVLWHVHRGRFNKSFTATSTKRGFFCGYVQDGGRFRGVPDGRISLLWSHPFFAGDAVSISGPTTASVNSRVASTFSGNASTGEELYDFASFTPCASTAQAEFKNYSGIYEVPVRGGFSKTVNSVPLTRSTYICAYLQVGAPAGKRPTGPTLATASQLITVS